MTQGQFTLFGDIELNFSENNQFLQASFTSSKDRFPIKAELLKNQLEAIGLGQLLLDQDAIIQLVKQYNTATSETVLNIAERVDAEFEIKTSQNSMQAYLNLSPAYGGAPVTKEHIEAALQEKNICHGIVQTAIDDALNAQQAESSEIASGKQAVDGKDGYIEKLIPEVRDRRPRIDNTGVANYKDIGQFITVKPGDKLVQIIEPTQGNDGKNIKGEAIAASPGKPVILNKNLKGTKISPESTAILIAAIAGQPVIVENGAMVEPTITVKDVDMKTGNIDFDGSVRVTGDVKTGMSIKTTGDISISGMVEEAVELCAGGDISVIKGVIGRGSLYDDEGKLGHGIVRISASGANSTIRARFIENAFIYSNYAVEVDELVSHCDIYARHSVSVGKQGAKRGHIMGGITKAEDLIEAQVLGSKASVATRLEAGTNIEYTEQLLETKELLQCKLSDRAGLEATFSKASKNKNSKQDVLGRLQATISQLTLDIGQLVRKQKNLESQITRLEKARIIARQNVFSGVDVILFNKNYKSSDELGPGSFDTKDNKAVFNRDLC